MSRKSQMELKAAQQRAAAHALRLPGAPSAWRWGLRASFPPQKGGVWGPGTARGAAPGEQPARTPRLQVQMEERRCLICTEQAQGLGLGFLINKVKGKELLVLKNRLREAGKAELKQAVLLQPSLPAPLRAAAAGHHGRAITRARRGCSPGQAPAPQSISFLWLSVSCALPQTQHIANHV